MGNSSYDLVDPTRVSKYRVEKNDSSIKSFEYERSGLSVHTKDYSKIETSLNMSELLAKTENPTNIYDAETPIPEYEGLNLKPYIGLDGTGSRVVVFTGDRLAGSTTHTAALALSAVVAGKSVFIVDLSTSGGIADMLKVANGEFRALNNVEMLNSSMALETSKLCVYENAAGETLSRILTFVQNRPNIFHSDLLFVNCNLNRLDTVLAIFNPKFSWVVVSSLLYYNSLETLLGADTRGAKTLVWLNDNVQAPIRQNKYAIDYFKSKVREIHSTWKFMSPVFFEDFEVGPDIYGLLEEVL